MYKAAVAGRAIQGVTNDHLVNDVWQHQDFSSRVLTSKRPSLRVSSSMQQFSCRVGSSGPLCAGQTDKAQASSQQCGSLPKTSKSPDLCFAVDCHKRQVAVLRERQARLSHQDTRRLIFWWFKAGLVWPRQAEQSVRRCNVAWNMKSSTATQIGRKPSALQLLLFYEQPSDLCNSGALR